MNHTVVMSAGHAAITRALAGLTEAQWSMPSARGHWSIKQTVAHLICYEELAEGALNTLLGRDTARMRALLKQMDDLPDTFNERFVAQYQGRSGVEILSELDAAHRRNMTALELIPADRLRQPDTLDWLDPGESIEDFLIFANYGHKREHAAEIAVARERMG